MRSKDDRQIIYFSRRLQSSPGGGEQCDEYLIRLLEDSGASIVVVSEPPGVIVPQAAERTMLNRVKEELGELWFVLRKIRMVFRATRVVYTGRSVTAAILSLFGPGKMIYNVHGLSNKTALRLFELTKTSILFWGRSYQMNDAPSFYDGHISLMPVSRLIGAKLEEHHAGVSFDKSFMYGRIAAMWLGRLEPIKDPELFVTAMHELNGLHDHWSAIMIGKGSLNDVVKQVVEDINLDCHGRFSFKGHVDNMALLEFFSSCNVLVVTSVTENFPLVVLEAILSGLKVVSVPIDAFTEDIFMGMVQFAPSRNPKDLALAIKKAALSSSAGELISIERILNKYKSQQERLSHWLR